MDVDLYKHIKKFYSSVDEIYGDIDEMREDLLTLEEWADIFESWKSYNEWKEIGRCVMRGQKSPLKLDGIALFHESQTAAKNNVRSSNIKAFDIYDDPDFCYEDDLGDPWMFQG